MRDISCWYNIHTVMYAQSLHFNKIFQCLKRENSVEEHAPRDLSSRIYAMTVLYMYSEYNIPGGTAELIRGVHRTLTPRWHLYFRRLLSNWNSSMRDTLD